MTRILPLLTLILAPLPLAAQQSCPTAADLDRGIRITFADGGTETFRRADPGVIAVTGREPDGSGFNMDLAQGLHLLMWEATTGGQPDAASRITYDYAGQPPTALPLPEAGRKWRTEVRVEDADFGPRDEPQSQVYGRLSQIEIGACSYVAIEVTISYATSDQYRETLRWLPDLGLAYLVWNESVDMSPIPVEATGIARVGK
jgi:hypothetical protein